MNKFWVFISVSIIVELSFALADKFLDARFFTDAELVIFSAIIALAVIVRKSR